MRNQTVIILFVFMLAGSVFGGVYSGGTGSEAHPYQIGDFNDLMELANTPGDYNECFIMTADIDLDPNLPGREVYSRALIAANNIDSIYRFEGTEFSGIFDGGEHKILNLTIDGGGGLGLFGYIASDGVVKNLGLEGGVVVGDEDLGKVGGLAGQNKGLVDSCFSKNTVMVGDRTWFIGGLVGRNYGVVKCCFTEAVIEAGRSNCAPGGLIGWNDHEGEVSNCYSIGEYVSYRIGGLVGSNYGQVSFCYSAGLVEAGWGGSGLINGSSGPALFSFWDMEATGQNSSDGGIGFNTAELKNINTYINNGWSGNTFWVIDNGNDYPRLYWENTPGVLITGEPDLSFFEGSGTEESPFLISDSQTLIKIFSMSLLWDRYFVLNADIDLAGNAFTKHLIGVPHGMAFKGVFDRNDYKIKNLLIEGDFYPALFGAIDIDGKVKNLGLEDVHISGNYYVGSLAYYNEGIIDNCYATGEIVLNDSSSGGLVVQNRGNITNSFANIDMTLAGDSGGVGGLVASNYALIDNCFSEGNSIICENCGGIGGLIGSNNGVVVNSYSTKSVNGDDRIGGLISYNDDSADLVCDCFATGSVTGNTTVGGLVGLSYGEIKNCYAGGDVAGVDYVGGLIGNNGLPIYNCYSTGLVKGNTNCGGLLGYCRPYSMVVENCFWDVESSQMETGVGSGYSLGIYGKTTAQMKSKGTFVDAGWDFVDVWGIGQWQTYPYLRRYSAADINADGAVNFVDLAILANNWLMEK